MKKLISKVISCSIVLSASVSLLAAAATPTVFADSESGKCGDNLTWLYDFDTYTLTITGTGKMYDYSATSDMFKNELTTAPWGNISFITDVVIDEGITYIGEFAFVSCDYLKNVSLPSSLTEIGNYAFIRSCRLENINLPYGLKKIGNCALMSTAITELTVPETVNEIGYAAFGYVPGLWSEESARRYPNFTLYGKKGSYVEEYAKNSGSAFVLEPLTFVDISEKPKELNIGDVNRDGNIDAKDATLILSYYAYTSTGGKLSFDEYAKLQS